MSRTYEQLEPVISALDDRIKTNLGAFPTDTAEGSIASFPDGADDIPLKSLVVNIDPVQDLHGQDAPYPAGGGKNLLDPSLLKDQASWNNIPVKVKPNTAYTMSTNKGTQESTGLALYFNNTNTQGGTESTAVRSGHPTTITSTSEGYVYVSQRRVSGEDSFQNYQCQIEEGSTATAYAPYENICPISGWTGANVTRCGKSFGELKPLAEWHKIRSYNIMTLDLPKDTLMYMSITDKDTSVDVSGYSIGFVDKNWDGTGNLTEYRWVVANGTINQDRFNKPTSGKNYYLSGLMIYPGTDAAYNALFARYNIMIETSQSPTDYEPYNGQTIPINWQTEAGTVYGGHLDVLTGVLTVDRAIVDLGTLTWTYFADKLLFLTTISDMVNPDNTVIGKITCDGYKAYSYNNLNADTSITGIAGRAKTSTKGIAVRDTRLGSDTTAFKSAVSGIMTTYPLETPITIQLTPHDVKTLLGQNNIWADTGDSAVEYRADTKMYIERLTAPDADMIADANITSGSYFMVGNTLYKATANIASGSAVIEGTNATRKSLSEALNEINS